MKLNFEKYKDKVYACWLGKNIGGTIGTPFEGTREFLDVKGYTSEKGEPLPNDDLDLQLVWLAALEQYGVHNITAERLGESWLSFITPPWSEYGVCKMNMSYGLKPPLSGDNENGLWRDSNGAWIRTEIWACVQPARPDIAIAYAIEDACVDHGSGEGTYAAAFVCAMQSAAFALNDIRDCIDVALSKIPEKSRVYSTVKLAIECYDKKVGLKEARNKIQKLNEDIGYGWFQAPSNIGYTVLGLLYGEGDFKKSVLYAVDCGDDTDCTGATVGATLGILGGTKIIPADWREYIGDGINTICVNNTNLPVMFRTPKTCTILTERVVKLARQAVNGINYPYKDLGEVFKYGVEFIEGVDEIEKDIKEKYLSCKRGRRYVDEILPNAVKVDFNVANATLYAPDGIRIKPNGELKLILRIENNCELVGHLPRILTTRWWLPEGFEVVGASTIKLEIWRHVNDPSSLEYIPPIVEEEYIIKVPEKIQADNKLVVELNVNGRPSVGYLPVHLIY